jgi:hypothetical protein
MKNYKEFSKRDLKESKYSDQLIDALRDCIDSAPDRTKNKLAQVYEDYVHKFMRRPQKLPYMLQGFLDAIEEGTDARIEWKGGGDRSDW